MLDRLHYYTYLYPDSLILAHSLSIVQFSHQQSVIHWHSFSGILHLAFFFHIIIQAAGTWTQVWAILEQRVSESCNKRPLDIVSVQCVFIGS